MLDRALVMSRCSQFSPSFLKGVFRNIFAACLILVVSFPPVMADEQAIEAELEDAAQNNNAETAVVDAAESKADKTVTGCGDVICACMPSILQFSSPTLAPDENGKYPIALEADEVVSEGGDLVTLIGNAEVSQGRQTIVADKLEYSRSSDQVVASGNVEMIANDGTYLASESINVHAPTQIGTLTNTDYKLASSLTSEGGIDTVQIESRGSADMVSLEGEGVILMEGVKYTTCQEGKDHVMINASKLELDRNSGIGKARNATIRFMGIPLFYSPYLSFPIDDERKTGLLVPEFGSDDESGRIIGLPWYWNIAKNQDATITPRNYSDRGLQIGAEYRHKSSVSETYVYGEYMSDDDLFGDSRDMLSVQHYQQFTDSLTGEINFNDVSDADYFDDFRESERYFSASYVPRNASLKYSGEYFSVSARASEYEIIDPDILESSKPYERLPSVSVKTKLPEGPWGSKFNFGATYNNFASDFRTEGKRTALHGSLELPFENLWGFVTPKVSVFHRRYDLDNVAAGGEDSPSYTVPIVSLDAGIFMERNINWFGEGALQTLEPRLFYVYAPNEFQDDVPIFDTSQVTLNNFGNIFRENRFYGEDRIGDTNQVTLGITSRIIDNKTGDQRLKASLGQLYLIDDLQQNLFSNRPIESGLGDLLLAVSSSSKGGWNTSAFVQYDHDESEIRTGNFSIGYGPKEDKRKSLYLGYYHSKGFTRDIDQVSLAFSWPLSARWRVFGDERYSIEDSDSLSTTLGLEYDGCCWKVRLTSQERLNNRDINDKKSAVFLQLELTNLGRIRTGL